MSATPILKAPAPGVTPEFFTLEIQQPLFFVVLSPCCSISDGMLLLAPLTSVRAAFYNNPYFAEDLTRINRVLAPEQAVPPDVWCRRRSESGGKWPIEKRIAMSVQTRVLS